MRVLLLGVSIVFTVLIGAATVSDIIRHGVNWLDVLAILVVVLFGTGLIGSLLQPPRQ